MRIRSLRDARSVSNFVALIDDRPMAGRALRFVELPGETVEAHESFLTDCCVLPPELGNCPFPTGAGYETDALAFTSLPGASINTRTGMVVSRDGGILEETIQGALVHHTQPELQEFARKMHRKNMHERPAVFFSFGPWTVYGHVICELLASMYSLTPLIKARKLDLVMPLGTTQWLDTLLDSLGITADMRVYPKSDWSSFRNLIVCSSCSGGATFRPGRALTRLAQQMSKQVAPATGNGLLYLTRWSSQTTTQDRVVEAEGELALGLETLGFKSYEPGSLPFVHQISLFKSARVIFGVHGSAFANVIFSPGGCIVGEILPAYWASNQGGNWITNLTNLFRQNYFYHLAPSKKLEGGAGNSVKIDVKKSLNAIETLLNRTTAETP